MLKNLILTIICAGTAICAPAQLKFSVLGDSYSTFAGNVTPEWNHVWYPNDNSRTDTPNDVSDVNQTWWKIIDNTPEYDLLVNNSFSGATISTHGYDNVDYAHRAYFTRAYNLGDNPDIIFVFGGTNDSWVGVDPGKNKFSDWTREDVRTFRPAFCKLMIELQAAYPGARIINITNSELSEEITGAMAELCEAFNVENVMLHDIDKQLGHPSQSGMKAIAEQVIQQLRQSSPETAPH